MTIYFDRRPGMVDRLYLRAATFSVVPPLLYTYPYLITQVIISSEFWG